MRSAEVAMPDRAMSFSSCATPCSQIPLDRDSQLRLVPLAANGRNSSVMKSRSSTLRMVSNMALRGFLLSAYP